MFENVIVETQGAIATFTLNRPKQLNAINSGLLRDLDAAIDTLTADVRVVIVTGSGEKAFAAGADISEMHGLPPEKATEFSAYGHRVFRRLETIPQVTIAAINGFALGGGLEVAMSCDLLYASDRAKLGQPEVNLGVIPGFGGTQRLARLVGPQRARELVFTADMIDGATAKSYGLVCDVLPAAELQAHVRKVAEKIASKGPLAIAEAKRVILSGWDLDLESANALESRAFGQLFATADLKEGMGAFLEKRAANFKGE